MKKTNLLKITKKWPNIIVLKLTFLFLFWTLARFCLVIRVFQKTPLSCYYGSDVKEDYVFGDYKSEWIGRG